MILRCIGILLLPVVLLAGGCSSEQPADVKQAGDSGSTVIVESEPATPSADDEGTEADVTVTEDVEEEPATAALGDLVDIGDWDVKVSKVLLNGDAQIRAANQFNDKPRGQYVLVTFEATYNGNERTADAYSDITWSLTTTDNRIHEEASAVTPADDEEWPTSVRRGGTARTQVAFDVPASMIEGGILTAEAYDEDFNTVFADFTL